MVRDRRRVKRTKAAKRKPMKAQASPFAKPRAVKAIPKPANRGPSLRGAPVAGRTARGRRWAIAAVLILLLSPPALTAVYRMEAIEQALEANQRRPNRIRGGSTISQQTAKNVFLWPQRSYVRKALEAGFTTLIEPLWGKRRIMEVYLNVVEWGPGVYGAQAASQRYFGHDAADLTALEAARLAAILPDPLNWKAVRPGRYVQSRSRIDAAAQTVRVDDLAACVLKDG